MAEGWLLNKVEWLECQKTYSKDVAAARSACKKKSNVFVILPTG